MAWAVLATLLFNSGCTSAQASGSLRTVSLGDNAVVFPTDFTSVFYSHDPESGTTSFMLSDVDPQRLLEGDVKDGQILHIELLWTPLAGFTPMDSSATNASIRYIILVDGHLGLYGGAGFAHPSSDPGAATLSVSLKDASIQLMESTSGFVDLLSPAQMTGAFKAKLDDKATRQMNFAASQIVTNILGRTRFVFHVEHDAVKNKKRPA
jgi:hypothetical protein